MRDDDRPEPCPNSEPLSPSLPAAGNGEPTPEDLLCLQSAVDDWQRERAALIQKLGAAESAAQENMQLATRLREASDQIETLKKSVHAVRARLEAEAQAAKARAEQAHKAAERSNAAVEELRVANAELTTALEATQGRLADLETENAVYREELQRVQQQRTPEPERLGALAAEVRQLSHDLPGKQAAEPSEALDTLRAEGDQLQAALDAATRQVQVLTDELASGQHAQADAAQQLETARAAHAEELRVWQETAMQREAELVAARDDLARCLEDEQSQTYLAHEQLEALGERLRGLEAEAATARQQRQEIEQELAATREENRRERTVFEATARQREEAHRQGADAARAALEAQLADRDAQRARLSARIVSLEEQLREREGQIEQLGIEEAETHERFARELATVRGALQTGNASVEAAQAEIRALEAQLAERDAQRGRFSNRIVALQEGVRERDHELEQLRGAAQALGEQHRTELQATVDAARELEARHRAVQSALHQALDEAQQRATDAAQAQAAAAARADELTDRIAALEQDSSRWREEHAAAIHAHEVIDTERHQLRERVDELAGQLRTLEHERDQIRNDHTAAAQAAEALAARAEELGKERREMLMRIDELGGLTAQLERECERLRRDRSSADEARKQKGEIVRLESKIEEIEHQRGEAAQHHSAAVAGYMIELNQRSETLHARELELQRLNEELALTKQACEDAVAQLAEERQEHSRIHRELMEQRALNAASARTTPEPAAKAAPAKTPSAPPRSVAKSGISERPAAEIPAPQAARPARPAGPITLIHLEENKDIRDKMREVIGRLPESRYLNALDAELGPGTGTQMLAVNLLIRAPDPLAAIASAISSDTAHQNVFAYCADGSCGFSFGAVDFFPQPIDPDACVSWLLESRGTIQRLLAASENVEMTTALRTVLSRMRCSTSVALDMRQVIDLLPMIEPDLVLIDLALPRGDGLRLVSRLRSDPKTRALPLGLLLPVTGNIAEFRQHALRAARESPLSPAQLTQALAERLGIPGPTDSKPKAASLLRTG